MGENENQDVLRELMDPKVSPYPNLLMGLADKERDARLMPDTFTLMALGHEYYEAAVALIATAPQAPAVDGVIMPVLFMYRQSVELALKDIILSLGAHLHLRAGELYELFAIHDLAKLLREVGAMHSRAKRYLDEIGTVLPPSEQAQRFIQELAAVDPEGMAFRYPYRKTKAKFPFAKLQPLINETVWVNLDVLQAGMLHVYKELTRYHELIQISTTLYEQYLADLRSEVGW